MPGKGLPRGRDKTPKDSGGVSKKGDTSENKRGREKKKTDRKSKLVPELERTEIMGQGARGAPRGRPRSKNSPEPEYVSEDDMLEELEENTNRAQPQAMTMGGQATLQLHVDEDDDLEYDSSAHDEDGGAENDLYYAGNKNKKEKPIVNFQSKEARTPSSNDPTVTHGGKLFHTPAPSDAYGDDTNIGVEEDWEEEIEL